MKKHIRKTGLAKPSVPENKPLLAKDIGKFNVACNAIVKHIALIVAAVLITSPAAGQEPTGVKV